MNLEGQRALPERFANAIPEAIHPKLIEAIERLVRSRKWPLFLYGKPGTGKSCAAAILYAAYNGDAKFYLTDQLVSKAIECRTNGKGFIEEYHPRVGTVQVYEKKIYERVERAGFVVFDDVGIRGLTDSRFEIFKELIERRGARPTVYTSNLSPKELASLYDARLVSRMTQGTIYALTDVRDRRIENNHFEELRLE